MNVLRLHPDNGDPAITIEDETVRVGRDAASDVHLKDASVSRQHAEIERRGDEWLIADRGSANGIRIDGRRTQQAVLLPGQQLHIGNLKFRVEIDRGDDGATVMLGRSPLLEEPGDRTLLGGAPPVFSEPAPPAPVEQKSGSTTWMVTAGVAVTVLVGLAFAAVAYFSAGPTKDRTPVPVVATPFPTPKPTPTPEPLPTPTPVRRPTGSLLISTDVDVSVWIDGRAVARLKASGLRRFDVAPGEHIVRFQSQGSQTEEVARVRVNEQTVVRHQGEVLPAATPAPSPSATP